MNDAQQALSHIQTVIDKLLDPAGGCPWDKAQTPLSLCEYLIEECHELVDAIRSGKPGHVGAVRKTVQLGPCVRRRQLRQSD